MQEAIVVYYVTSKKNNLEVLNAMLSDGWRVVSQNPMGGQCGAAMYSLVILEKEEK
ncbi:hypothetical protein A8990_10749 [Paenibacillus taihuensis]|uniref:DUF4177 domain-containing protein n=1 Tax=Paenibacillus taihuensis TaxID=1156355 RepID=A0A3D9SFL4_9BACL|nr:hypothetical protein [Paenibacillus taihuensis]REE88953.1 hypothetical protein A8990_10749 [Paenibacillus taihuensis]